MASEATKLGYAEIVDIIEEVKSSNRLRSSAGNVFWRQDEEGNIFNAVIKVNNKLPKSEYIDTIRHELAHVITEAEDGTRKFEKFCVKHNIGLKHDFDIGEDYKYNIYCSHCDSIVKRYKRDCQSLRSLKENPEDWKCTLCGTVGELEVREID